MSIAGCGALLLLCARACGVDGLGAGRVDGYLLTLAAERELKVTFGPNMGQWQILPKNVVVFDENSLEPNLVRQSTQPV